MTVYANQKECQTDVKEIHNSHDATDQKLLLKLVESQGKHIVFLENLINTKMSKILEMTKQFNTMEKKLLKIVEDINTKKKK